MPHLLVVEKTYFQMQKKPTANPLYSSCQTIASGSWFALP